ncbi:MAG: ArsR family transcriptional regulator [Thaumarchaeota archaeon]|nr:ArsR family transcriptional regulator [Nitrososphaerota archaeon]
MKQGELDSVLQVIENPVRRRIIKRLSQEACYALQLSKELGLGQPLVAKHLSIMESAGLVTSLLESSPNGPERKRYLLAKSISITMDLAPNLFMERAVAFGGAPAKKSSREIGLLNRRVRIALDNPDDRERLSLISEIVDDVDKKMRAVEGERVALLSLKNTAMTEAARIASKLEGLDTKRVLFHILDEHDREVESISRSLNLREMAVRSILDELEDVFG